MTKKDKWIQNVAPKKGALHKQLGIPSTKTFPTKTLQDVVKTEVGHKSHGVTITKLTKERATFALNVRKKK